MSVIERWFAENRPEGACVVSDQDEPGTVMALCGRQQDAREIALALNNHRGAVSREHAVQAIGWLSAEVAIHGAPELGGEWVELWDRALTATGGQS